MLRRAAGLILSPEREWAAIARERPAVLAVLGGHVLPFAAIPAIAWMGGLALFGMELVLVGEPIARPGASAILRAGLATYLGSIASVAGLAGAIWLIAPMYGARRRDWSGAWAVAAFGATPAWVAGIVLLKPALFIAMLPVCLYCLFLCHSGLRALGFARDDEASEYVAIAIVLLLAGSALAGGLLASFGAM